MAVVGKAVLVVEAPLKEAFAKFIDFSQWKDWMPELFTPVSGPSHPLREGDKFKVRLAVGPLKPTLPINTMRVQEGREVTWGGGIPGLLKAEHCFFFENMGDGRTRIRSEETFTGLLTSPKPIATQMKKEIERIGEAQLAGFGQWIKKASA